MRLKGRDPTVESPNIIYQEIPVIAVVVAITVTGGALFYICRLHLRIRESERAVQVGMGRPN